MQNKEVVANVAMITENVLNFQIVLKPGDTAKQIREHLGVHSPDSLCRWPERVPFDDNEDVYDAVINKKCAIYIRSRS